METFEIITNCINLLAQKEEKSFTYTFDGGRHSFVETGCVSPYLLFNTTYAVYGTLEALLSTVEEYCTEPTYSIGDKFKKTSYSKYVLASPKDGYVVLFNPKTGGRWDDLFKVEDVMRITESEMEKGITRFCQFVKI